MNQPLILIIEDDDLQYELYEETLAQYELVRTATASDALRAVAKTPPNLILLDHILAKGELGLDYLGELKELVPYVPVIVVSGALEVHQQMTALQGPRRAHYCITKPVDLNELTRTIETALKDCGEAEIVRQFEALERSKRVDVQELLSRSTDRLSRQKQIRPPCARRRRDVPRLSSPAIVSQQGKGRRFDTLHRPTQFVAGLNLRLGLKRE